MMEGKENRKIDGMWDPEYTKGFEDGLRNLKFRPTSRLYLKGYDRGRESAKIGKYHGHAVIPADEK
jgi:hypothetical protein